MSNPNASLQALRAQWQARWATMAPRERQRAQNDRVTSDAV